MSKARPELKGMSAFYWESMDRSWRAGGWSLAVFFILYSAAAAVVGFFGGGVWLLLFILIVIAVVFTLVERKVQRKFFDKELKGMRAEKDKK